MAEIVNLRQARKARARMEAEAAAARNRVAFGRSRKERQANEALNELEKQRHESHRLEPQPQPDASEKT